MWIESIHWHKLLPKYFSVFHLLLSNGFNLIKNPVSMFSIDVVLHVHLSNCFDINDHTNIIINELLHRKNILKQMHIKGGVTFAPKDSCRILGEK